MGLLKIFFIIFIFLFPVAEIGRVQFANGVAISVNDILLVALIIFWVLSHFYKKKKFGKYFLLKPIAAFSAVAFIALVLNILNLSLDKFFISFSYLVRWLAYASLYFMVDDFDKKFKRKVSLLMLFSGFVVVALGFVQYFFYPNLRNLYYLGWDEHLYRLFSTFLDPNFAGAFFAIFFIYSLNFFREFFTKKQWFKSILLGFISVLTLLALYLTYSRSALIMLVIGVVVYLFVIRQKKLIIFSVIALLAFIFLLPRAFVTEGTNFLRSASGDARLESVGVAIKIIEKNPIFGVGFDAYRYAQNKIGLNNQTWMITHSGAGTDNSFLFVLATTGIVGFCAFLYFLYKLLRLGIISKKNKYAVVLLPVLIGLFFNSLFLNSFFYVLILEWVWILAAFTESN